MASCRAREPTACEDQFFTDFMASARLFGKKYDLFTVEMKPPGGKYNGAYTDLVKVGKEMKIMVDELALAGVKEPIVCGMVVKGILREDM